MKFLSEEAQRVKDLYPNISDTELLDRMFSQPPLSRVPEKDRAEVLNRFSKPGDVFWFFERHYKKYRRFLETPKNQKDQTKK